MDKSKRIPKTVDEYLESLPADVHTTLEKLRKTIKSVAPKAEEVISYGMPGYKYNGALLYFAAFKNHCSLFPGGSSLKDLVEELKPYRTSKGTLQFTIDKPLPTSLVKKIVKKRMEENDGKLLLKQLKKSASKNKKSSKSTDTEKVDAYMDALKHPLKKEIQAVRAIIKNSNKKISERIKWNAPSYYYKEDFVTFNPRAVTHVNLVFHHPFIVEIKSPLLEGNYKDRRLIYFKNMKEVKANKEELERIMQELIKKLGKK